MAAKQPGWRNPRHAAQWRVTLETYAKPLWSRPVDEIDTAAVLSRLGADLGERFRKPPRVFAAASKPCSTPRRRKVIARVKTRLLGADISSTF